MPSVIAERVTDQLPALSAVAVPTVEVPSETTIVLDASAVPFNVGVATLVGDTGVDATITGAAGAVVSMVTTNAEEGAETLPAASVDVAVKD